MGWNGSFQVLGSWKSCCIFTTLVVLGRLDGGGVWGLSSLMEGRFLVRWMLVSSKRTLYAIYRAMFVGCILSGLGILCIRFIPFMQGLSVVRDRFVVILWLFSRESYMACFFMLYVASMVGFAVFLFGCVWRWS